jgi:hypothetical protein
MKSVLKYVVISAVFIAVAIAQQKTDAEIRISRLQEAFAQLKKTPRSMEQVSPAQDKLLEQIVDDVVFLHRENIALRKELENLKAPR